MAKEADRRYQSTADMVVDLESLSDKLKSGRSTILQAQAVSQATTTQPLATAQSPAGPLARYRVMKLLKTGRVAGCDWTANGRRSRRNGRRGLRYGTGFSPTALFGRFFIPFFLKHAAVRHRCHIEEGTTQSLRQPKSTRQPGKSVL